MTYASEPRVAPLWSAPLGFEPNLERPPPATLGPATSVTVSEVPLVPAASPEVAYWGITRRRTHEDELADLAYKISYAGALLLTADRIWRSVDSLLDSMRLEGRDGQEIRLVCEPASGGFEVTVRVSRPINF